SCDTVTVAFSGPLVSNDTITRVAPSPQLNRAVRPGWEVRSDMVPSVSHRSRDPGSTNASKTRSTGAAIVLEAEILNPSARWCFRRSPRTRWYQTVIDCAHHPGTPCSPARYAAVSLC